MERAVGADADARAVRLGRVLERPVADQYAARPPVVLVEVVGDHADRRRRRAQRASPCRSSFSRPSSVSFDSTGDSEYRPPGLGAGDDVEHDRPVRANCTRFAFVTPGISSVGAASCAKRARRTEKRQEQEDREAETHEPPRSVPTSDDDSVIEIVLVHSGVTDSGEWDGVRPLLEHGAPGVHPDLPGFGTTPDVRGELSLARDYVLSVFDGPAALVGHVVRRARVLEAALAAPERVSQLVLIGANPFGWSGEVQRVQSQEGGAVRGAAPGRRGGADGALVAVGPEREADQVDAELYERVRRMNRRSLRAAGRRREHAAPGGDRAGARHRADSRRRGALDWPDVAAAARDSSTRLPNAREVVVERCAHLPTMEASGRGRAADPRLRRVRTLAIRPTRRPLRSRVRSPRASGRLVAASRPADASPVVRATPSRANPRSSTNGWSSRPAHGFARSTRRGVLARRAPRQHRVHRRGDVPRRDRRRRRRRPSFAQRAARRADAGAGASGSRA